MYLIYIYIENKNKNIYKISLLSLMFQFYKLYLVSGVYSRVYIYKIGKSIHL